MKKTNLFKFLVAFVMGVSIVACGGTDKSTNNNSSQASSTNSTNHSTTSKDDTSSNSSTGDKTSNDVNSSTSTKDSVPIVDFPEDSRTIYAKVDGWTSVNAYAWGSAGSNAGWPGVPMTNVEGDIWSIDVDLESGFQNIIFNNGTSQTLDLEIYDNVSIYIVENDGASVSYGTYKDGVITPVDIEIPVPTDCYLVGNLTGWSHNQTYMFSYDEATDTATFTIELDAEDPSVDGNGFKVTIGTGWNNQFNSDNTTLPDGMVDAGAAGDSNNNIVVVTAGTYTFTVAGVTTDAPTLTIVLEPVVEE